MHECTPCKNAGMDDRGADEEDEQRDPTVSCDRCEAVCCRLTVVLMPEDRVDPRFTARDDHGLEVMARGEDGWCVALDRKTMLCGIYEQRPAICRSFSMGGPYCRDERDQWYRQGRYRDIPIALC
jgi:Fe-S-cluster containining protein